MRKATACKQEVYTSLPVKDRLEVTQLRFFFYHMSLRHLMQLLFIQSHNFALMTIFCLFYSPFCTTACFIPLSLLRT